MESIKKTICFEPFRSRFNGKLPAIGTINCGETESYFDDEVEYSDYSRIPYDIKFCDGHKRGDECCGVSFDSTLGDLINSLSPIASNLPCAVSGSCEDKTDTAYTETHILRYKTMLEDYKLINDIARGVGYDNFEKTIKKNIHYYYLCKKGGNDYEWLEITEEMWTDRFSLFENGESGPDCYYYDSSLPTSLKKFFFHKCMYLAKELPSVYLYYFLTTNGDIASTTENGSIPSYYSYTNPEGDTEYVEYDEYIPTYYSYVDNNGETKYVRMASEIERGINEYHRSEPPDLRTVGADELFADKYSLPTSKLLYKEGDVICISPQIDTFISKFRKDFELKETWLSPSTIIDTGYTPTLKDYKSGKIVGYDNETGYEVIPDPCSERYEIKFIKLVEYLHKNKLTREEKDYFVSVPYADIPLFIEEETHDMGLMSAYYEDWIPNKKYFIGDVVRYGNRCYVLVSGETEDVNYFKGYFDEMTKITYFDFVDENKKLIRDEDGNLTHWHPSHTTADDFNQFFTTGDTIELVAGSRLHTLQRYVKSTDDENGQELPFIYKYIGENRDKIDVNTEMKYLIDVQNITQYQDTIYCDVLDCVTFSINGNEDTAIYFKGNHSDIETDTGRTTVCSVIDTEMLKDYTDYNTARFNYTIRYRVNEETGEIDFNSGLKYEEEYACAFKEMWIECENYDTTAQGSEIKYVWLEYVPPKETSALDTQEEYEDGEDFEPVDNSIYPTNNGVEMDNPSEHIGEVWKWMGDSYSETIDGETFTYIQGNTYRSARLCKFIYVDISNPKIYSSEAEMENGEPQAHVTFSREMMSYDIFQIVGTYRDEALFGVHDTNVDSNIFIDRGIGVSVVERHSILSEVDTLEDLERYRNDYFGLTSENTTQ